MRIKQQELPFNYNDDKLAIVSWSGTRGDWWYIQKKTNPHKCLYASSSGEYYYDVKQFSKQVPVIWNNKRAALQVARSKQGRVRQFPYKLRSESKP